MHPEPGGVFPTIRGAMAGCSLNPTATLLAGRRFAANHLRRLTENSSSLPVGGRRGRTILDRENVFLESLVQGGQPTGTDQFQASSGRR